MDPEKGKGFNQNLQELPDFLILTLAKSMVSAAKAANLSLLSLLDSEYEAGPPPPVLDPTLFWKSILGVQFPSGF